MIRKLLFLLTLALVATLAPASAQAGEVYSAKIIAKQKK